MGRGILPLLKNKTKQIDYCSALHLSNVSEPQLPYLFCALRYSEQNGLCSFQFVSYVF